MLLILVDMTFKQIEHKVFIKQSSFRLDIVEIHLLLVEIEKCTSVNNNSFPPQKKKIIKKNVLVTKLSSSYLGKCNVGFFVTESDCFDKFLRDKVFIVSLL